MLQLVVRLAADQEVLAAAAGLHVLNANVEALADDAAIDLFAGGGGQGEGQTQACSAKISAGVMSVPLPGCAGAAAAAAAVQ